MHFFPHNIKMKGKNIIFYDVKINKSSFYRSKRLFKTDDSNINKILVSRKTLC